MKKVIVLDANILFRAVLGEKVPLLLSAYKERVDFFTPAFCYGEVRKHAPRIATIKDVPVEPILENITQFEKVVIPVDALFYSVNEAEARSRIEARDVNDWPIVALALTLNCPIWSEDQDFFGTGVATWNGRNVERYLKS